MADRIRSVDYLPEVFRTGINKQFLGSTLDQLTQEPKLKATQGYIGRRVGPGVDPNDKYVVEPDATRSDYQLEPGVIFLGDDNNKVEDAITYPGLINRLSVNGANTTKQDRLFKSEQYSWDPLCDFDKFVNYGQYYWLVDGPDVVNIGSTEVLIENDYTVTRGTSGYTFSGVVGTLPTITLARQGNYTFTVDQTGNPFWIQSKPGASGLDSGGVTTREVFGVSNNGTDDGTVTFFVPRADAQDFYNTLTDDGSVDLATRLSYNQVNGVTVSSLVASGGIDGITDLDTRTLVFFDPDLPEPGSQIYSVYTIEYVGAVDPTIQLTVLRDVDNLSKLGVDFGDEFGGTSIYKTAEGIYLKIPQITANLDTLYYQDVTNPDYFGIINIIDVPDSPPINVNTILASANYTSPNGVTFTNGLKVQFRGDTIPSSYETGQYYVEGVGTQIQLLPTGNFVTPESYTETSDEQNDSTAEPYQPDAQDYITINRASPDRNAWTRSNRWFHEDVVYATAEYNKTVPVLDNNKRGSRPIIEFRSGLRLYNFGTQAIEPVNIIDTKETDAFSNINGTTGYTVDGYSFEQGTRVIFSNDSDPVVRSRVYAVNFIDPGDSTEVIDLQPADILIPGSSTNTVALVLDGTTLKGTTYTFNGNTWVLSQQKTSVNQAPLFDVFDSNGYSYSNTDIYSGSNFFGSKLFSYATGAGSADTILGFPLKYLTINNVGDIVFENNLYTDSFIYTVDNTSITLAIKNGTPRIYTDIATYTSQLGWQTTFTDRVSRQQFQFEYTGLPLRLDVKVSDNSTLIPVKVFENGVFILPSAYTVTTNAQGNSVITFNTPPATGSTIEVNVISDTASTAAFYTVPSNLENNAINKDVTTLTLGTIRNHYSSLCQNLTDLSGKIIGANNTRDLGNIIPYGRTIQQQSSPLTFASTFLHNNEFDFFKSIDFAGVEYEKLKNIILETAISKDWTGYTTAQILDNVLEDINVGKNQMSPFYWTDTIPSGFVYDETNYTISAISGTVFDTLYTYDFTKANYKGLLVYLNNQILVGDGHEYTVATDGPRITVNVALSTGDVLTIREYTTTYGSFVPSTPSALGLAKRYEPTKYLDNTYITPTNVILGHDGSLTVAYNDFRDDLLLEFEKRIYSNIKVSDAYNPPIDPDDIIPGQFRTTDWTLTDINEILSVSFLSWLGRNRLSYKEQDYDANNQFTWNYTNSQSKLDGSLLLGNWRGIYFDLYDTDSPHTRPWEMLGLTEKPSWWETQYGPAPYTSGNTVLWSDLRDGKINDPFGTPVIVNDYKRPQLLDCLPVDSAGNLLSPMDSIVGNYDQLSFQKNWNFGDQGPTETAWRRSSAYRFALQRLMALCLPAQYFTLFADRDLYNYNTSFNQYLYNNRFRLNPENLEVYGDGLAKNSYINYIVDYNRRLGLDSTTLLETRLDNLDVRLCYRMASFSDKNYLKIFTEKSSPDSQNASLLLPDESYNLLLYKNPTQSVVQYSSVVVQRTTLGYQVFGYSNAQPYFEIYKSIPNGNFTNVTISGTTVRLPNDFTSTVVKVPYGYEFTSLSGLADFLMSYGQYLGAQGLTFDNTANGVILNWAQMVQEVVYWSNQGWTAGSIINLNPAANVLQIYKKNQVAENLLQPTAEQNLLNQNKVPFKSGEFAVERIDNDLKLTAFNNNTFSYINAKFTAYEHIIVFDNTSIFNDLIYDPGTGARQSRLFLNGYTTYDWNGVLDAQGFILNQDNIKEWTPNSAYSKGEIVLYKDSYWSAAKIIPPSGTFNFNDWIESDYNSIQKGLLPNSATKASQLINVYDIQTANLEQDADQLAFGLIGFRPRQYMQNLNLDDISQVNLYKQFLKTKGTTQATDLFKQANLNKEVAEYNIYENWGVKRALYGANANRSWFEIQTNESLLQSNPSVIQIINPQQDSIADQQVLLQDLYGESYKITDTNVLPTTTETPPDLRLPTAGYVNYDDVEIKVFDYNDLTAVINSLDEVREGTNIWVAKANRYDWNVYRTVQSQGRLTQAKDNLNGTVTLTFNINHNISANQNIVIKNFDPQVDGAYQVVSVPSLRTIIIALSFEGEVTTITSTGVVLVLESVRVAQASDISNLSFVNTLGNDSQVWVDNDGTDHWAVYKKTNPFAAAISVDLGSGDDNLNSLFGSSVTQGFINNGAMVGSPGYNSGAGAVWLYNKVDNVTYVNTGVFSPSITDLSEYGYSMDSGNTEWAVVGAPSSSSSRGLTTNVKRNTATGEYTLEQVLLESNTSADSEFGYSVAISNDERWMYIGAPGNSIDNTYEFGLFAYNKVNVQNQLVTFTGDGFTNLFYIADDIIIDDDSADGGIGAQQINVRVNDVAYQPNVNFYYNGGYLTFTTIPRDGAIIEVSRKQTISFYPTVSTTVFDIAELYTADDIYSFVIYVNGTIQRPLLDYTFDAGTKIVTFTSGVTGGVRVDSKDHWILVDEISYAGVTTDSSTTPRFGNAVSTTTDGRQVMVGSPNDNPGEKDFAGTVQVIDRSVERFQLVNTTTRAFTTTATPNTPVSVKLNNEFLIPTDGFNNNGQFSVSGSTVTLATTVNIAVGDILEVETNNFNLIQSITSNNSQTLGKFGDELDQCSTNCSLYIGQPNDNAQRVEGGSVERWINVARLFGTITSTTANPTLTVGNSIRIQNYYVELTGTTVASLATDITNADIPNITASAANGLLTINLANVAAGDEYIKLQVLPGVGTAYSDLGFNLLSYAQTIYPPSNVDYAHFGTTVKIDDDANTLMVGAPDGSAELPITFDNNTTIFDSNATNITSTAARSGVLFTFDYLRSANSSASNPGKFVFGQQFYGQDLQENDKFGASASYQGGILWVGAPNDDLGDSSGDFGRVLQFNNPDQKFSWAQIYRQLPIVDTSLLNSVFTYNKLTSGDVTYLDYIDPLQGKILGAAKQNIDLIGSTDPASYNVGSVNNYGQTWVEDYEGNIWWDITNVRFINYHQDDLTYKSRRWGQLFPGSSVDIYQWIESTVPPADYAGPGTVYSTTSYSVNTVLNADGDFSTQYYYWVKGLSNVSGNVGKTLSSAAITQYIENPRSSGLPYMAPISPSSVALYNVEDLLVATDTILHVEFDRIRNNDNVHVEYDLIAEGDENSFLSDGLYRKLLDSLVSEDTAGNVVPDPTLSIASRYGTNFRPRQSFFVDRFLALENYITRANAILKLYPIAETKKLDLLKSEQPEPTSASGEWNKRLATYAELTYQDLRLVPVGYRYLVASDETNDGLWTIYQVQSDRTLLLALVQSYYTPAYWTYADWSLPGYNTATRPVAEVALYSDLLKLTNVEDGSSVKVLANSIGKFEIFQLVSGEWVRVVAEDATIQISTTVYDYESGRYGFDAEVFDAQRFDQNPKVETRQILKALNEEIFTDDLLIYRNELLILMFEYILTEDSAPDWLTKTSLINVSHKIRDLLPYQIYRQDNQDFVLDYLKEVKPYHVKIAEFNLLYDGLDSYPGTVTDFDLPAEYNDTSKIFVSPILSSDEASTNLSVRLPTWEGWSQLPYNQWYDNYTLTFDSVTVIEGGSGYTVAPTVTVTGTATRQAELVASINTSGEVIAITVVDPGAGYTVTPTITITEGNGEGARAKAVMVNQTTRNINTTIKFDRYEYQSNVLDWTANTKYAEGQLVRYLGNVYSVNEVDDSTELDSGAEFDPADYTIVDQSTLSGVDRIIGLYTADVNEPGRELALLIAGIDYPGVQVTGPLFSQNTGFDVGNYDTQPFDNFEFGPEGLPTYSTSILNTIYQSSFTDTYLGTQPSDINVDGSEFIDTYSSHAPEELVPGAMFDTMDMIVNTRPGSDWENDGHGFAIETIFADYVSGGVTISYAGLIEDPVFIMVENQSLRQMLNSIDNYTVDWINQTVTVTSGAIVGHAIGVTAYGLGGGSQLFRQDYPGNQVGNSLVVPVDSDQIYSMFIVVDGTPISNFTYTRVDAYNTRIDFDDTYTASNNVFVAVLGTTTPQAVWSSLITEEFEYDGSTLAFILANSVQGTNPVNLGVYRNGFRLRPPEAAEYTGDGSSLGQPYFLPDTGGTLQSSIADSDVYVYVDNVLQTLTTDYTVSAPSGSDTRWIEFTTPPASGADILIAVWTSAAYTVVSNVVTLNTAPIPGSIISVTTFNDTSEQNLLTKVFQGPTTTGVIVQEGYDDTNFDAATLPDTSGTFDYTVGTTVSLNEWDLGRTVTNLERIIVSKNGQRLYGGLDFTVDGTTITVGGSIFGALDTLEVTMMTQSVTPDAMSFRIFQDMLGNQKILRLYSGNKTQLAQALGETDTVIYVDDASKLAEPVLTDNVFGVVIIDNERITYSSRDTSNNTLSGLRRGVSGTSITSHSVDAVVSNAGIGDQLPATYQQKITKDNFTGDGSTKVFTCTNVTLPTNVDSTFNEEAVRVKVGGKDLLDTEYTVTNDGGADPVEVTLDAAPGDGVAIEVYKVTAKVMYAQGASTASNGIALQQQTTDAANFLRGLI